MRVNRLGLVPLTSPDASVRRYRLARLEEVALETPPNGSEPATQADVGHVVVDMRRQSASPPAGIRDRRVG
jgi:hypothetical protein